MGYQKMVGIRCCQRGMKFVGVVFSIGCVDNSYEGFNSYRGGMKRHTINPVASDAKIGVLNKLQCKMLCICFIEQIHIL